MQRVVLRQGLWRHCWFIGVYLLARKGSGYLWTLGAQREQLWAVKDEPGKKTRDKKRVTTKKEQQNKSSPVAMLASRSLSRPMKIAANVFICGIFLFLPACVVQ